MSMRRKMKNPGSRTAARVQKTMIMQNLQKMQKVQEIQGSPVIPEALKTAGNNQQTGSDPFEERRRKR